MLALLGHQQDDDDHCLQRSGAIHLVSEALTGTV